MQVGEVATAATRDEDLFAGALSAFEYGNAAATTIRNRRRPRNRTPQREPQALARLRVVFVD